MYTNVLNLEESIDGNRIKQGDLSVMRYILTDANSDDLQLDGRPAKVYLTDVDGIKYIYATTVKEQDDKYLCDVIIDAIIPAGTYTLEIWVDNTYCFPSDNKAKIRVESSVLGNGIEQLHSETLLADIIDYAKKHDLIDYKPVTISSVTNDEEGNVIVNFTDTTQILIPRGERGQSIEIQAITPKLNGDTEVIFTDGNSLIIPKGKDGENGSDGTSVKVDYTEKDALGNTVVHFSDGKEAVISKGTKGKDGKSITVVSTNKDKNDNTVVTFSDGTSATISKGDKGDKGDTVLVPPKIYTRDEYDQLETKDNNTLYFISEV